MQSKITKVICTCSCGEKRDHMRPLRNPLKIHLDEYRDIRADLTSAHKPDHYLVHDVTTLVMYENRS